MLKIFSAIIIHFMDLTRSTVFYIVQSVFCLISSLASLAILVLYCYSNSLKIYSFKFVFHLILQNLIRSAMLLVPVQVIEINHALCSLSAYLFYASALSSTIWTLFIALNLYQVIFLKSLDSERRFKLFLFCALFVPYALCTLPFVFHAYGPNGVNCLLNNNHEGLIFRLLLYYIPTFVACVVCLCIYVRIFRTFYKEISTSTGQKDIIRLLYFPLIMIVCVMPLFIYIIIEYAGYENYYVWLVLSCIWSMQGLLDVVAYALTRPIVRFIKINLTTDTSLLETKSFSVYMSS